MFWETASIFPSENKIGIRNNNLEKSNLKYSTYIQFYKNAKKVDYWYSKKIRAVV